MKITNNKGSYSVIFLVIVAIGIFFFLYKNGVIGDLKSPQEQAKQASIARTLKGVSMALITYQEVSGNYPGMLESLTNPPDGGQPYLTESTLSVKGYMYEYISLYDNFELRLNPESDVDYFYFTDKSRVIRMQLKSPAHEKSQILYN